MFTPELACLDLQECCELPPGTLIAPLPVMREIRCALGPSGLNLQVGDQDVVLISSDLFAAFQAWQAAQEEEDGSGPDHSLLN